MSFSRKEGHPNIQPSTRPGIEPGPQDWEAEILTTAPTPPLWNDKIFTKFSPREGGGGPTSPFLSSLDYTTHFTSTDGHILCTLIKKTFSTNLLEMACESSKYSCVFYLPPRSHVGPRNCSKSLQQWKKRRQSDCYSRPMV